MFMTRGTLWQVPEDAVVPILSKVEFHLEQWTVGYPAPVSPVPGINGNGPCPLLTLFIITPS